MPCKNGMATVNTKSAQPAREANICDALCTFLNIWRLVRGRCDWNLLPTCQISRPTGAGPIHWDVWLTWSFLIEFIHIAAILTLRPHYLFQQRVSRGPLSPFSIHTFKLSKLNQSSLSPAVHLIHRWLRATPQINQSNKILPQLLH